MLTKLPVLLHGGDYNPDQWLHSPEILDKDVRLMKEAGCNAMSVGIFAWAALEPQEGVYDFQWLDSIIEKMYQNGVYTILATPSGARPAWMASKYPEVLRVNEDGKRIAFSARHNHCYTSPVYKKFVTRINAALAERYSNNPAVILWHISNEYGGDCHCELCTTAFIQWLKERYGSLGALNHAWWNSFWSHTITDWNQIKSPLAFGEKNLHGLTLDWRRFVTHQTVEFMKMEVAPLKAVSSLPVTTNMMGYYEGLNYAKFRGVTDVISWDSYPMWHREDDACYSDYISAAHDLMRSIYPNKPWLLMESTPSVTNWSPVSKLKRPGMHVLSSLHAIAHGSDSVQYFQWRKSRGSSEKFHGAVVDHYGQADTRVFQDVAEVGRRLKSLEKIAGAEFKSKAAIIFDTENRWAVKDAMGPRNVSIGHEDEMLLHYSALRRLGINTDLVDMETDISSYSLVVAPMLYMFRANIAQKLKTFVENGGTLVMTYWSGIVNESDLCWLGGMPGDGMTQVMGLRSEEIDGLYDGDTNSLVITGLDGMKESYKVHTLCDLIVPSTAKALGHYGCDFYAGRPALTVNSFGKGKAYYVAARCEKEFYLDFYSKLAEDLELILIPGLPEKVRMTVRYGRDAYYFLMNFGADEEMVELPETFENIETGDRADRICLKGYEVVVLAKGKV